MRRAYPYYKTGAGQVRSCHLRRIRSVPLLKGRMVLLLHGHHCLYPCYHGQFARSCSFLPDCRHEAHELTFCVISLLQRAFSLGRVTRLANISIRAIYHLLSAVYCPPPSRLPRTLSVSRFGNGTSANGCRYVLISPGGHQVLSVLPSQARDRLTSC